MKRVLFHNLSANSVQLVTNQLFGLVVFYILSTRLNKSTFGQINLSLAILLAVFNILSFGIDQIVIKKVAAGEDQQQLLSAYIFHVLISGLLFYGLLVIGCCFITGNHSIIYLLLLIGAGKLMNYLSTPLKSITSGLELFRLLAQMSVIGNILKGSLLIMFALLKMIDLRVIIAVFIFGDIVESAVTIWLFKFRITTPLKVKWSKVNYIQLLKESLPQTGVVLVTSALARFDWIFIGVFLSAVKLAEYSFAYKVFEMAALPLLAVAPILIPRFTKMFKQGTMLTANLRFEIRLELMVAALIGLILNVCWTQVFDPLTGGKYGLVNVKTVFILTLCMPLLYLNNFLWTIYFTQARLTMILRSFIVTLLVNVSADLILIPIYKNEGAAFAFLLSCLAQTAYYIKQNKLAELNHIWQPLMICTACAVCSGFAVKFVFINIWQALPVAIIFYFLFLIATSQIRPADRENLKAVLSQ